MIEKSRRFLILVVSRRCPNCKVPAGPGSNGTDYDCPDCGGGFCSRCFVPDYKGNGNCVFCPHCRVKLYFSEEILVALNSR